MNESKIKKNIRSVNEFINKGNMFVIATGNNYDYFIKVAKEKGIRYDYLILDQGSVISDRYNKIIYSCTLNNNILKSICYELREVYNIHKIEIYSAKRKECSFINKKITKISIKFNKKTSALKIITILNKKYGKYINAYLMIFSNSYIVEIISSKTDKEKAIRIIANIEKVDKSSIYTIGNGYNDISMINAFNGACVNNSVDELLKRCNRHVESVNELVYKIL